MNYLLFVISGALSFVPLFAVILKPSRFWPLLVIISVCTGGIVVSSLGVADEIIVGGIIVGYLIFLGISRCPIFDRRRNALDELHFLFFVSMAVYMAMQSIYGMVDLDSLRKLRWFLYFAMLGILAFILSRRKISAPPSEDLAMITAVSGFVYFAAYLGVGSLFEIISGNPRWDMQNILWGGTTYAAFPVIAVLPAVFLLLQSGRHLRRILGWLTLAIISIAAFYYDSRISYIAVIGFLLLLLPLLGVRRFIIPATLFFGIASIFICVFWSSFYSFEIYGKVLYESTEFLWNPSQAHDAGRLAHLAIGPLLVKDDPRALLFGHGFRTSGQLVGPALAQIYENQGMHELALQSAHYGSTVGLTALLIETGIVGIGFLAANFIMTAAKIIASRAGKIKIVLLYCLILAFMWLMITDPIDIVLFYLIIMPSGIFYCFLDNKMSVNYRAIAAGNIHK